ncbi:MAG TPA: sugar transferase [Solirubrobacterales bacterium]|nr:sugar transferase [Solirubrobacterales bacterium]
MESSTVDHSERAHGESRRDSLSLGPRSERSRPRHRGVVMAKMMFAGDVIAALLAATAALVILDGPVTDSPLFVIAVALLWPLLAFSIGLYRADQLSSWASAVPEVPRGVVAIMLMTWPIFGLAALMGIGPAIATAFVTVGAMAILAGIARTVVRATLHRNPALRQRTLILGSGVVAGQVVEKIRTNQQFGLDPVGLVDNVVHDIGTPDLPRFGGFADLGKIIEMQSIDRVIIAFSRVSHEELLEAIRACRDAGVAVDVVPRLFEFLDGVRSLDQIGGLPLISIGAPALGSTMVAAKRVLDIIGSAALLLIFSPVLVTTAIAIKLESKGPVFFLQSRAGRGNRSFNLIKFRSMYIDAEQRKADLDAMNESDDGVMFKIRDDPRITRVGAFIRRFSIDELPQLFNVLKGEMSLVGPRPLIFSETAALEERWHLRRLELRPGMTGPWQVYGRSDSPFQEMVRFDYQYVAGWSLARDVELLLATIPAVASGRGAY